MNYKNWDCPYTLYTPKNKFQVKIKKNVSDLDKKVLIIRPDRLGDFCVTFPAILFLSKYTKIYRWINKSYNKLFNKLGEIFDLSNIEIVNYDIDYNKLFSYDYEKISKIQKVKLFVDFLINKDFINLFKVFKKYDIIIDLVGRRRFQFVMSLVKFFYNTSIYGIYRSLTGKFLDGLLYKGDFENFVDQFISFFSYIYNIGIQDFKKYYKNKLDNIKTQNYIFIHIGYGGESSRNLLVKNWEKIIKYLLNKNQNIILVYTDMEYKEGEYLKNLFQKTVKFYKNPDFELFFDLISKTKFFIGVDSGPFHLADILGKKGIVFFSRENDNTWGSWFGNINAIKQFDKVCLTRNCGYDYCMIKKLDLDSWFKGL